MLKVLPHTCAKETKLNQCVEPKNRLGQGLSRFGVTLRYVTRPRHVVTLPTPNANRGSGAVKSSYFLCTAPGCLSYLPCPSQRPDLRQIYGYSPNSKRPPQSVCSYPYYVISYRYRWTILDGTSLGGTRPTKEFLALLKMIIVPSDFHLEALPSRESVDADGVITPGDYLVGASMYKSE
jgi:hypothetical protein